MTPQRGPKDAGQSKLACIECRRQHLKCDGKKPVCGRCTLSAEACHYQPSRRGRGRRSLAHGPAQRHEEHSATISSSMDTSLDHGSSTGPSSSGVVHVSDPSQSAAASIVALTPDATSSSTTPSPSSANILPYTAPLPSGPMPWAALPRKGVVNPGRPQTLAGLAVTNSVSRSVRLYYENFHTAHPILVPSSMFKERAYPAFLRLVIDFAGAHYSQSIPGQQQKEHVFGELTRNPDRSPCMVQAWLIYSIILFARGEIGEVHSALTRGAEIAIETGMNRADFASSRHPERSIEAESLRRTWWELFITEILISTSCSNVEFRCSKLPFEVTFPCEETAYVNNNTELPKPRTMFDFKRRILFDDGVGFSSFTYRIEATRILGRVLALNRHREYHRDHFQSIENTLVSWTNHMPSAKLEIVNAHGQMDEMLFQAHTIITYAGMLLHLPRSNFSSIVSDMSEPYRSEASECFPSTPHMRLVQSIKATEASRRMSDYISLCPNLQKHSPFILPVLVLCGLAQLATSISHSDDCFEHHYNRITLALGCLKSMNGTWAFAESAYYRLRTHAAAMIGDSIDKCNPGNLPESNTMNHSTPGEFSRPMDRLDATTMGAEGQELLLPELDQCFIDEVCYNNTLFSSLLNFNHV